MEIAEFILGVIVTLLLVLIINSCSGNATEMFIDKYGVSATDDQLMTILGNGYWYLNEIYNVNAYNFADSNDYIEKKFDNAYNSLLTFAKQYAVNVPGSLYSIAISPDGLNQDDPVKNTTPNGLLALQSYRSNIKNIMKFNVMPPIKLRVLYNIVFDAIYNRYIATSKLYLDSSSIEEMNVSGLAY